MGANKSNYYKKIGKYGLKKYNNIKNKSRIPKIIIRMFRFSLSCFAITRVSKTLFRFRIYP